MDQIPYRTGGEVETCSEDFNGSCLKHFSTGYGPPSSRPSQKVERRDKGRETTDISERKILGEEHRPNDSDPGENHSGGQEGAFSNPGPPRPGFNIRDQSQLAPNISPYSTISLTLRSPTGREFSSEG